MKLALGIAVVVALYAAGLVPEGLQVVAAWVVIAAIHGRMIVVARSTARTPGLTPPIRRFWHAVAGAGGVYLLGDLAQVVAAARDPGAATAATGGPIQMGALSLGSAWLMLTLLTVPLGFTSRRDRNRFWMDVATVMAAAVVVGWYLVVPQWPGALLEVLAGPVILLLCVFVVAKLVMSGTAPFTMACGLIGAGGAAVKTGADLLSRDGLGAGRLPFFLALTIASHALLTIALQINRAQLAGTAGTARPRRRKPYSLLPYGAIAVTYLLLTVAVVRDAHQTMPIALAGAAVSTLLVVLRQLAAFKELHETQEGLRASLAERDALAARLRHHAFHDGLTGLPNRSLYAERVDAALAEGRPVAVMLIDLDDFKEVNDVQGHAAGDALLREVAQRLRACVRETDTVARIGGDEFAVLLLGDGDDPQDVAGRMVRAVEAPVTLANGGTARVGASVGIAVSGATTKDGDSLLREADHAMYEVKRDGKGSFALARSGSLH